MKLSTFTKKIIFIFIISSLCFKFINGQTTETDLHKKYWYYKSRFNNDFISIGTGTGQSIPFNQRGFNWTNYPWSGNNGHIGTQVP